MTTFKRLQKGLSLVELLIALALSSFVATAIYQIVLSNRTNVVLVDSFSKVQESARLAIELMARDLRMAGYAGCVNNVANTTNHLSTADSEYLAPLHNFNQKLEGFNSYSGAAIGGKTPVANTDVLYSRSASAADLFLKSDVVATSTGFLVGGAEANSSLIAPGVIVAITDCNTMDLFGVSAVNNAFGAIWHNFAVPGGPNNTSATLANPYAKGSQVLLMNSFSYFVAPSSAVVDANGNFVNSLYKYSDLGGANAQELVPYIENLQFEYGLDTNADFNVDVYRTADLVTAAQFASNVMSIKFTITVDVGDATKSAKDNQQANLSRSYTRVVQIRNAAIGSNGAGVTP